VTEPFVNYKKGLKLLRNHGSTDYHQLCIEKGSAFLQNFNAGGSKSISIMIDDKTKKIVEANKQRLTPIIKTIIFCGWNNLAFRGHRDDGSLNPNTAIIGNEGVVRSLLAFRVDSGDQILVEHLKTSNKNATMISKIKQNELINVLHQVVNEGK